MPKSKPPYPAAFKQQIVELVMAGRTRSIWRPISVGQSFLPVNLDGTHDRSSEGC